MVFLEEFTDTGMIRPIECRSIKTTARKTEEDYVHVAEIEGSCREFSDGVIET